MTIEVEADIVTEPTMDETIGVIGRKVDSTRTDATLPLELLPQL